MLLLKKIPDEYMNLVIAPNYFLLKLDLFILAGGIKYPRCL
jgi:hypothetical protein